MRMPSLTNESLGSIFVERVRQFVNVVGLDRKFVGENLAASLYGVTEALAEISPLDSCQNDLQPLRPMSRTPRAR